MAEDKTLPGWPSKKLVADVKRTLRRVLECRPTINNRYWRLAWEWASNVRRRNELYDFSKRRRPKWPSSTEIASMYIWICLCELKSSCQLRLPFHAATQIPASFKSEMSLASVPMIERLEQNGKAFLESLDRDNAAVAGNLGFDG